MPDELEVRQVGRRLRHARKVQQLRLKDVAAEVGCSESLLSKIENDRAAPSLRMLHRIAKVLGTSIGYLFGDDEETHMAIYRLGTRPVLVIQNEDTNGSIRLERLVPHVEKQIIDGNIHVIEPGATNGGEIEHAGQEIGYVLEGQFELKVADQVFILRKGDSFFFRSDLPHSYRNPSRSTARVLWVNTPPTF